MEAREVIPSGFAGEVNQGFYIFQWWWARCQGGGPNPSGSDGNCDWISRGSAVHATTLGLRTSSGQTDLCRADACAPFRLWVLTKQEGLLCRGWGSHGSSSTDLSKEASQMSSSFSCMRGTRHLHRSWTTPHIVPGGASNHAAQCCKALASTTVSSLETTQARWGIPPACFVVWAASSLKPAVCFFASPCTSGSLSCPGLRDQSSSH